jgi:c-di-AMP phosphodiesterase-like protein
MEPNEVNLVVYHASCFDGFAGAWSAWRKLGEYARYIPATYAVPPVDLPKTARVLMIDVSYDRETMEEIRSKVADLYLLDHHKSAMEELGDLDYTYFDLNKSGGMLAWEFFHSNTPVPPLIEYIQDRDLLRFKLYQGSEVMAGLRSYPKNFVVWSGLTMHHLVERGRTILTYENELIESMAEQAELRNLAGYEAIPVTNATVLWAEVCEKMLDMHPKAKFVAAYRDKKDGTRKWSIRSRGKFDVSKIAMKLDKKGGGHLNGAGWSAKAPDPVGE